MISVSKCGVRLRLPTIALAGVGGALLLAACASSPPPVVALNAAKQAIAVADQAHIADASSPELAEARTRLAAADTAVVAKHMDEAERLAQESRADAELAFAQSEAAKNQAVNDEMLHSTDTLSHEMQRNAGATP
jgi:type IV secretory pathway TrbF-like protein